MKSSRDEERGGGRREGKERRRGKGGEATYGGAGGDSACGVEISSFIARNTRMRLDFMEGDG